MQLLSNPTLPKTNKKVELVAIFLVYNIFLLTNATLNSVISVDEPFYINAAGLMRDSGDFLLPKLYSGEARINKPILIYWMASLGQWMVGDPIYGARLVAIAFTNLHMILIYLFCYQLFNDNRIGLNALWMFASTPQLMERSHTFLPEILVISLITWNLMIFWKIRAGEKVAQNLMLFYFLFAINFLIKGPPGVVLPFVAIVSFCTIRGEFQILKSLISLKGLSIFLLIVSPWFVYVEIFINPGFMFSVFQREIVERLVDVHSPLLFLSIFHQFQPWVIALVIMIFLDRYQKWPPANKASVQFIWIWFISITAFINLVIRELHTHYTLDIVVPVLILTSCYLTRANKNMTRWVVPFTAAIAIASRVAYYYNFNGKDIFNDDHLLILVISGLSAIFLIGGLAWLKLCSIRIVSILIIILFAVEFHLVRENARLIHQRQVYEKIESRDDIRVITGNPKLGVILSLHWYHLNRKISHEMIYDFDRFQEKLMNENFQYAFCSDESWMQFTDEVTDSWQIIETVYDQNHEVFASSANLIYSRSRLNIIQPYIKYYLIKKAAKP